MSPLAFFLFLGNATRYPGKATRLREADLRQCLSFAFLGFSEQLSGSDFLPLWRVPKGPILGLGFSPCPISPSKLVFPIFRRAKNSPPKPNEGQEGQGEDFADKRHHSKAVSV